MKPLMMFFCLVVLAACASAPVVPAPVLPGGRQPSAEQGDGEWRELEVGSVDPGVFKRAEQAVRENQSRDERLKACGAEGILREGALERDLLLIRAREWDETRFRTEYAGRLAAGARLCLLAPR